jgi:protein O-GlcNAc transferase
MANGDRDRALALGEEAIRLAPQDPKVADNVMTALMGAKDLNRLTALANFISARFPSLPNAHYYQAVSLLLHKRSDDAIAEAHRALAVEPRHARAHQLIGAACLTLERYDCAEAALTAALEADPKDATPYIRLGELRLRMADASAAYNYFAQALFLSGGSDAARKGLREARAALAGRR